MYADFGEVIMRILFANDGIGDAGGVQQYLVAAMSGLVARGHELGSLHYSRKTQSGIALTLVSIPHFGVMDTGLDRTIADITAWAPQVCFSHNMGKLDVERRLLNEWPVVKLMHGYFGTCIGGQKMFSLPSPKPCGRQFGKTCLAFYFPRGCGQRSLSTLVAHYRWAKHQNNLFQYYAAVIVASEHMKREYINNGMNEEKIHVNPLFPTPLLSKIEPFQPDPGERRVLFLGRMTKLKGGDFLIHAVAEASQRIGHDIHLVMAGEGPQRPSWERLAQRLRISCTFTGWVTGEKHLQLLSEATLLAVPSLWPEPFGLVGLEAARVGVPAIAFDVGGIREWLRDGVNGYLVPGNPPNYRALAGGLVKAFTQPEKLMSMRRMGREVALEMSLERHLDKLEDVLATASAHRV